MGNQVTPSSITPHPFEKAHRVEFSLSLSLSSFLSRCQILATTVCAASLLLFPMYYTERERRREREREIESRNCVTGHFAHSLSLSLLDSANCMCWKALAIAICFIPCCTYTCIHRKARYLYLYIYTISITINFPSSAPHSYSSMTDFVPGAVPVHMHLVNFSLFYTNVCLIYIYVYKLCYTSIKSRAQIGEVKQKRVGASVE